MVVPFTELRAACDGGEDREGGEIWSSDLDVLGLRGLLEYNRVQVSS